jgi:hypothetical protein
MVCLFELCVTNVGFAVLAPVFGLYNKSACYAGITECFGGTSRLISSIRTS